MIILVRKREAKWQDLITSTCHQIKGISILTKYLKIQASKLWKRLNFLSDIPNLSHILQLSLTNQY